MTTETEISTEVDLAGIAELAETFNVGRTTVSNWYARQNTNGFPDPIKALAMGPVWDKAVVVDWYRGYKPLRNMVKVGSLPEQREHLEQGGAEANLGG